MIAQSNYRRQAVKKETTVYSKFRGVDFSVDPSMVSASRSPYAPNLISDIGGMPEKRLGWRCLHQISWTAAPAEGEETGETVIGNINGLFRCEMNDTEHLIAHAGTRLYRWTDPTEAAEGAFTLLMDGVTDHRSASFFMADHGEEPEEGDPKPEGKLYILTGGEYLVYDGTTVKHVSETAYTPTVVISKNPDGTGGKTYEGVNLIGTQRKESFYGTETDKVYHLSAENIESVDKVETLNKDGDWVETTAYSKDLTAGTVTFTTAPGVSPAQYEDNVRITYTKTVAGYADRIAKCTIAATYGYGGGSYVFLSGNPDYKAYDWHSDIDRPNYFPDTGYSIVGSEETAIMGYQKIGKYLVIVKEDNNQDTTIFQRWGTTSTDILGNQTPAFSMEPGISGVGAISKYAFGTLLDEPLFLSTRGVMATYNNNILAERTVKNRSFFVDAKLTKESGLENACACEWQGYFILAVNGRAYVLDSKNKSLRQNRTEGDGDFVYECYHWENIPARVLLSVGDRLYFGTVDGKICRFNTDIDKLDRYNDNPGLTAETEVPVVCCWSTKNDDDGASYLYKTMQKKGCTITIKPFYRSSAEIYIAKDGDPEKRIRQHLMDIFNWFDLDFERFTFNTNDSPQDIYLKKKIKKYKRLQIFVYNRGKSEGFGIYQIAKTFAVGNYAKK